MYAVRTNNEYFDEERMKWHIESMELWNINNSFEIRVVDYFDDFEDNVSRYTMTFNREELNDYLTTMYNTKVNTGFINACYSYLSSLGKEGDNV